MHCSSDGTNYTCVLGVGAGGGAGTVTQVDTGGLATGGPITASGTVTVTAATKARQETGTSTTTVVTPANQKNNDSAARAWVLADGAAGCNPCTNSLNVGSVVRTGTRRYTISFTVGFATTGYSCQYTQDNATTFASGIIGIFQTKATGSVTLATDNISVTGADAQGINVVCFGRQ
jgi:hypothetical protein